MERKGEEDIGFFIRKRWSHKILVITGFALIIFFIAHLTFLANDSLIPYTDEIILVMISLIATSFLTESIYRLEKGSIYEIFYSFYISITLIILSVIYWISYLYPQDIDFGAFRTSLIVIHIIVFIYALLTLHHSYKLSFILVAYVSVVVITILVFAYLHWTANVFDMGYLQYTSCESVDETLRSENWFYFSSVTFYGLGYGDICPIKNTSRILSQVEVALGALINTILIGFIFWKIKEMDVNKKRIKENGIESYKAQTLPSSYH